jgi:putative tricarboxylic transport membrane protein
MLALAAGYYLLAVRIPESDLADAVGPQGLPRIYAYVLGGLALVLIGQSMRSGREPKGESRKPSAGSKVLRPAGVIAIGAIYIAVVPWMGYLPSLAVLIAASTYYQGGGFDRRVAFVAVSGAVLFWLLFVMLLGIQHPPGFWPELF